MKKYIVFALFSLLFYSRLSAQSITYVDSEYVLKHVPEYSSAQKQLDALAQLWQKEIDNKFLDLEKLQKDYQADMVLLTDDMRKSREAEIGQKDKEVKDLQQQKFGFEGELYQQKIKLIKPIQERVAKAIEEYASKENIDIVLDKSSVTLLFARANYDGTNDIIIKMGYKPGSFAK
jgi:outer membrane protein